jgi:hypothetical protein
MPSDVTRHLAATRRMANVDRILQIKMRRDRGQIVRVVIHVVSFARLTGSAVTSTIVRDHAKAVIQKKQHLRIPVVGR